MWIPNQAQALTEVFDILQPNGVLACIEPDYAGRIEIHANTHHIKPKPPYPIVTLLTRLGANPYTGAHLPWELSKFGFQQIRFGVLSSTFDHQIIKTEIHCEANFLHEKGIDWALPDFIYTPIFWILARK